MPPDLPEVTPFGGGVDGPVEIILDRGDLPFGEGRLDVAAVVRGLRSVPLVCGSFGTESAYHGAVRPVSAMAAIVLPARRNVRDLDANGREKRGHTMSQEKLAEFVAVTAKEFDIPGVAVGVLAGGQEFVASHGVTSLENPLPVDDKTLFPLASVTKSFTATAMMRLVAEGKVDLDAPVRRYVPELRLADEAAAARITVLNLLNHTAGLDWNLIDTDGSDGSLAAFVAKLNELTLIAPPGARASYSQAGYNLAGRVIEKVTGLPFEKAVAALVLEPAGLSNTFFDHDDVMIRRFAVGYNRGEDGSMRAARPWTSWRAGAQANYPGGGSVSSVSDLLRWPGSTSAPVTVCCPPRRCAACRSRRSNCGPARSATPSASAGSCVRWTGSTPSGTADRATGSSPSCSSCPNATSPSSPWPTAALTATPSTRLSSAGHWRTTSAWSTGTPSRSPTTRRGLGRSSAATRSTP
jgi:CubicO group peptidase (beta-lactamase class C family)